MEEIHRTRHGESTWRLHAPSENITFLKLPRVHQQGSSLNPVLLSFCRSFITKAQLIELWIIGDWTQSPASFTFSVVRQSSNPLVTWLAPLTTSPHYQVLSKSHQYNNMMSSILNFRLGWKGVCYEQQETHSTFMTLKQFQELRTRDQVLWQKMLLLLRKF